MLRIAKGLALTSVAAAAVAGTAGVAAATTDAGAQAAAASSPGVLSGNVVQVPGYVPLNLTGNTVNVVGVLNPAWGNSSVIN